MADTARRRDRRLEVDELAIEPVEVVTLARDGRSLPGDQRGQVGVDLAALEAEAGHPAGVLGPEPQPPQADHESKAGQVDVVVFAIAVGLSDASGRIPTDSYQRTAEGAIPARRRARRPSRGDRTPSSHLKVKRGVASGHSHHIGAGLPTYRSVPWSSTSPSSRCWSPGTRSIAARLDRISIGPALAFLAIGIVMADESSGRSPSSRRPNRSGSSPRSTLTLLLFADASTVRPDALRRDLSPVARLLIVGLLLTIALGSLTAVVLFPGIPLGVAVLIGATLAPTDAALGQPVVTNPVVPARIRRLLNVESGLNDGIATPFVILAIALSTAEADGHSGWLLDALSATAVGLVVGVAAGLAGGSLLRLADRRAWTSHVSAAAVRAGAGASCYLVSVSLGGNGFIAAFVGGLAFGRGQPLARGKCRSSSPRSRGRCWRSACGWPSDSRSLASSSPTSGTRWRSSTRSSASP